MRWPRWLRPRLFAFCPGCGGDSREHDVRRLAQERFCPESETSGIEAALSRGDLEAARRLDDRNAWGDLLVHQLIRCGDETWLVTVEDPLLFEPRVRRSTKLGGEER